MSSSRFQPRASKHGGSVNLHEIMMGVEHDQQRRVVAALAHAGRLGAPVHQHAEALRAIVVPRLGGHLRAVGADPRHVLDVDVRDRSAPVKKRGAAQDRIFVAQARQPAEEVDQRLLLSSSMRPVDPADLVVLAIGVVVAAAACGRTRRPPATIGVPCDSSSVASMLRIWRSRSALIAGVVGRALDAAVPGAVVANCRRWLSSPFASLCFSL